MNDATKVELVVMAAGMGSRFGGVKQLSPVGPHGEILLDYAIYDAMRAGVHRVVFVIREAIRQAFEEHVLARYENRLEVAVVCQETNLLPSNFSALPERTKPWGTGHAIWCARAAVRGPFIAINADDFYGAQAIANLAAMLVSSGDRTHAMIAYHLGQTTSEFGSVSRGICTIDAAGYLLNVEEHPKIVVSGERLLSLTQGDPQVLSSDTPVSMNCWGFQPTIFADLERTFVEFLRHNGKSLSAEFYLPKAVDVLIAEERVKVAVRPCSTPWFGLTYPEDGDRVRERLREAVRCGEYPSPLWQPALLGAPQ
jgi:UTP-glucose-1-phosphate uridylyltransferase